jgi:hypothetical protein
MQHGWLTHAGKFRVDHIPCPHPGEPVDLSAPPKGVQHTVEGSFESGLAVFRRHFAPHFLVGRKRGGALSIAQLVPLGFMAAALENHSGGVETNRIVRVQIELADFSKHQPWLPDAGVQELLAQLYLTLEQAADIPLRHVPVLRKPRLWEREPGWFGHVDVPENAHWDSGSLEYGKLFARAHALDDPFAGPPEWHEVKVNPKPRRLDRARTAPVRLAALRAEPRSCHTHARDVA